MLSNKKPWLMAILISCGVIVQSCPDEGKEPGEYVNKKGGFAISFPQGWELHENAMQLDAAALAPLESVNDRFRENVTVASSPLDTAMDAEAVLESQMPTMLKLITDFKVEERGEATIGGQKAVWLTYTQLQGKDRLKTTMYAAAGKEKAWLIHCTAEISAYDKYRDTFETTVQSFRILE